MASKLLIGRRIVLSAILSFIVLGCGEPSGSTGRSAPQDKGVRDMPTRPKDFVVRYDWCEGSVPPPYHYEYAIHIGPSLHGQIVFYPDYPSHNPPVWTEQFPISEKDLDALYVLMVEKQVLSKEWRRVEDGPVGGSLEWMDVVADGKNHSVPSMIKDPKALTEVYARIRSLVPENIWKGLMARRAAFERDYEKKDK